MAVNDTPPSRFRGTRWLWLAAVVVLGAGAFLGYQVAYQSSLGGLGGALGAAFLAMAIGGLVVLVGLVGVGNALRPEGRGRVASRFSFAAAVLLVAGAVGGYFAVPVFGLGYHPPVVLQARGEASATLEGAAAFEPREAGRADCQSVADGIDVEHIVALSLGTLNGSVLRAEITLPIAGISGSYLSLFVDAAHLPEGSMQPMWSSLEAQVDAATGGTSGSITFEDAPIREDPELDLPVGSWPPTLSGEIRWTCHDWFDPYASTPPTLVGHVSLDLVGEDWAAEPDALGSCEFEPDGSVWVFASDRIGLLQGRPMNINLDLGGDPGPRNEVILRLGVQEEALPTGASAGVRNLLAATSGGPIVSWVDLVTLDEVSHGGLGGRVTFQEVPREGTPNLDWPLTLSGELTWECG